MKRKIDQSHFEPVEVEIRGVRYHSETAAARALGVPQTAIHKALERGTLDYVGLGRNYLTRYRLIFEGVTYDSAQEFSDKRPDLKGNAPSTVRKYCREAKEKRMSHIDTPFGRLHILPKPQE